MVEGDADEASARPGVTAASSVVAYFAGFCGFAERLTRPRRECSR